MAASVSISAVIKSQQPAWRKHHVMALAKISVWQHQWRQRFSIINSVKHHGAKLMLKRIARIALSASNSAISSQQAKVSSENSGNEISMKAGNNERNNGKAKSEEKAKSNVGGENNEKQRKYRKPKSGEIMANQLKERNNSREKRRKMAQMKKINERNISVMALSASAMYQRHQ
jgi:hypothetical protein